MTATDSRSSSAPNPRRRLLLLAADWQTRALTLAELKERGHQVLALPGLRWGLKALLQDRVDPPLVFVDVKDDDFVSPEEIRHLRELLPDAAVVLLTGVFERESYAPLESVVDRVLVRPISIGEIVQAIEEELANVHGRDPRPESR